MVVRCVVVALLWVGLSSLAYATENDPLIQSSITEEPVRDPSLVEMKFDLGDGEETFWIYSRPNVTTFYEDGNAPSNQKVIPKYKGLGVKFINLSKKTVIVYWERIPGQFEKGEAVNARVLEPFMSRGSGSYSGHRFVLATNDEPTVAVLRTVISSPPNNLVVYDAFHVEGDDEQTQRNLAVLSQAELEKYQKWRKTIAFSEKYAAVTGRAYLSAYPRKRPIHFMWPADYIGQTHWVTTRETHFDAMPPDIRLAPFVSEGTCRKLRVDQPRLLHEYRVPDVLNMTLRVVSVAPRVLEIPDFLSLTEVRHILNLAHDLKRSTTGDPAMKQQQESTSRTSHNTWIKRERTPIVDAVYRRAADLMRIDESLMRRRPDGERPDFFDQRSITEQLQLVHYNEGQQYIAHHDFGFPSLDDYHQRARFSTLLLYLNEGMEGGETTFPVWTNAETFEQLRVVPKIGKAVLFYSILPDGNMDDLSLHEARKIRNGEKWIVNLWTWDPVGGF